MKDSNKCEAQKCRNEYTIELKHINKKYCEEHYKKYNEIYEQTKQKTDKEE